MDSAVAGADLGMEYPGGGRPDQSPVQIPAGQWRVRAVGRSIRTATSHGSAWCSSSPGTVTPDARCPCHSNCGHCRRRPQRQHAQRPATSGTGGRPGPMVTVTVPAACCPLPAARRPGVGPRCRARLATGPAVPVVLSRRRRASASASRHVWVSSRDRQGSLPPCRRAPASRARVARPPGSGPACPPPGRSATTPVGHQAAAVKPVPLPSGSLGRPRAACAVLVACRLAALRCASA